MTAKDTKRGRPIGSKTDKTETTAGEPVPSRCKACGSTNRTKYENTRTTELAHPGLDEQGKPYTHTIWRNTACTDCGQRRVDRSRENRSGRRRPKP